MKKAAMILTALVLVFLSCAPVPAAAGSTPVFMWEDCALQLLSYKIKKGKYTSASMDLYGRLINNKDYTLAIMLDDAEINGVKVLATLIVAEAHGDTGAEDPDSFYIMAPAENKEAASDAIANARILSGTLVFWNSDKKEEVFRQKFSIELGVLDGTRDIAAPTRTATPRPTATPKPTARPTAKPTAKQDTNARRSGAYAPAYTPASTDYIGFKEGSNAQAVKDVQQRLYNLGYYTDKIDGNYGLTSIIAVRSFCGQHGLPVQTSVTPEMQRLLYSDRAEYYAEPYIPLLIGPYYKWDNPQYKDNIGWFYPQVVNRCGRAIRGYELYYYFEDVWGNKLKAEQNGAYRYPYQSAHTVEPGYCVYNNTGFPIYPFASVYTVYVGVHKIVFADGEIREIAVDDISYSSCPIKR